MPDATVCLTFDFDAVSPWLYDEDATPTNISRGLFGADVGAPRLLDLLSRHDADSTWFTPGHTIESFPEICGEIHDRGHGIQHHGWSHLPPGQYESGVAEREDVERGVDAIQDLTGDKPTGYRSPSWDFSDHTLDILCDLGFEWDSSGMAHDFEPYYLQRNWNAPPDDPYERGEETAILDLPVSWQRDDYPAFAFSPNRGYANERAVFEMWRAGFDWMAENVEGGVYVLTMHPQVSGHAHRLDHLEALIGHMADRGATFETMSAVADRFG